MKFGKLSVIQEIERPVEKNYGRRWVLCKCECGNTLSVALEKIKYGQITSCGCQKKLRGPDSPYWKGYGEISGDYYTACKRRAKGGGQFNKSEKEFSVSMEYLWNKFLEQNKKCVISGIPLTFDCRGRRADQKHWETNKITASLDRIDSTKGYVNGNVQWVHKHVNMMKNDMTDKQLIEYCRIIAKNNP